MDNAAVNARDDAATISSLPTNLKYVVAIKIRIKQIIINGEL